MTVQHIVDRALGEQEFALNAGMERDGLKHRVCLHADRTAGWDDALAANILECDYCPAVAFVSPGVALHLPAWYWVEMPMGR